MKISDVVKSKGSAVVTVRPDATVQELVQLLAEHNIGAVVVTPADDDQTVAGIVSERDIVRRLASHGADLMSLPVSQIMTTDVHTCTHGDSVEGLAGQMTQHRVRHMPVVEESRLVAIVTIGDVVKHRLSQLQDERDQLVGYISQ